MSELGPESRALVDRARRGLGPDELAIRRMRARVGATIAAGAGTALATHTAAATTTTAAATTTTAAAATGASLAVKVAVLAIATSAAIGTGVHVVRTRAVPAVEAPIVEVAPSAPSRAFELAPPIVVHAREVAPVLVAPVIVAPPPPHRAIPAAAISLARETELVDAAFSALSHGRTADALVAIRRYDGETHGRGQLAEDASAIEIEAHCRLGDDHAAEALAAFDTRWPNAPEHAKLAAACAP